MRLGKLTTALILAPLAIAFVLLPLYPIAVYFEFRHSVLSEVVTGLTLLFLGWLAGRLAKRWPKLLGDEAITGGPQLTVARTGAMCGVVLLVTVGAVYVLSSQQWTTLWSLLIWCGAFCVLIMMVHLLERWWLAADRVRTLESRNSG